MFKLIKITGGTSNVPEPTYVNVNGITPYVAHCAYHVYSGTVSCASSENMELRDLKFIALETLPTNSGKKRLCGYYVTENMIFETDFHGNPSGIGAGDCLSFYVDENCEYNNSGVRDLPGNDARIIDSTNIAKTGKVLVALQFNNC